MAPAKDNTFIKTVKEIVSSSIVHNLKEHTKDFVHKVQQVVYQTTENVMEKLFSGLLFGVGMIFIALAVALLLAQYLELSMGWSLLIIGLLLLVVSLLLKAKVSKKKFFDFTR